MKLDQRRRPALLAALEHAFSADGASPLDPSVPAAVWRRALGEPAAQFLARPSKALRTTIVTAGLSLRAAEISRSYFECVDSWTARSDMRNSFRS